MNVDARHDALEQAGLDVAGRALFRPAVNPSTGSRLVARSVQSGCCGAALRRAMRARQAALSEAGWQMAEDVARFQCSVFAAAMAGWPAAERQPCTRLFVRFADAIVLALGVERTS